MKKDLIGRMDEIHAAIEVFFRENPGWQDAYFSADKNGIYATRINYETISGIAQDVPHIDLRTVFEVGNKS